MGAAQFGMKMTIGSPAGYQPKPAVLERARQLARGRLEVAVTDDPVAAVTGADVVYTDTWTSMGQEAEAEQRRAIFPPYQVNEALLSHAAEHAIVLHCLPAHRGEEITDEVADGPRSRLFPQAENRLHAQKAILVHLLGVGGAADDEGEQAEPTEKKPKKKGKKDKKDK